MKGTPGSNGSELRQGYVLGVVRLQVLSHSLDYEVLPANGQILSLLLDVGTREMLHNREKERLAIYCRRAICDGPVQSHQSGE